MSRRICIRAKTHKPMREIVQPILRKYMPDVEMENIVISVASDKTGSRKSLNFEDPVLTLNNQRLELEVKGQTGSTLRPKEKKVAESPVKVPRKTSKKVKRRRESFGPLKRMRERKKLLMMDISSSSKASDGHLRY